jgi:putative flippase GtrA
MALTSTAAQPRPPVPLHSSVVLDVVVPVHNEEIDLSRCVRRLHDYLTTTVPYPCQITIADNASTDTTLTVAHELAAELPHVQVLHLPEKGRGRALHAAWSASTAPVLAYMDVDLSTDLAALLPLVAPLLTGHSDLAIGSRLARGSRVVRGFKREAISRGYNLLLRGALAARFSDAQCGFKAIRRDVAEELLPLVRDTGWFFDTELLVLAERSGLRIHEVPVDWIDDPDSRVDIAATALADLRGIVRLARALAAEALPLADLRRRLARPPLTGLPSRLGPQALRFASIGIASTLAYVIVYFGLRQALSAQAANLMALLLTAVANTAANRRITFGVVGRRHALRHHLQGLFVFALGLGLTSGALAGLHAIVPNPAHLVELGVLVVANLVGTVVRFVLLRQWLHHRITGAPQQPQLAHK